MSRSLHKVCEKNFTPPSEHEEQAKVIAWTEVNKDRYPDVDMIFAVPNGAMKTKAGARKFKREGLKSGVPDLVLPVVTAEHPGLYIEMKKIKGGTVSDDQKEWLRRLEGQGYKTVVARGHREAIRAIDNYYSQE